MSKTAKFKINQKVKYINLVGTIIDHKIEIFGGVEYNIYLVKYEDMQCWAFEDSLVEVDGND